MKRVIQDSCKFCGKEVSRKPKQFCDNKCQKDFEHLKYIREWKNGEQKGYIGSQKFISKHIAKYMRKKYGDACMKCSWDLINEFTGSVPVEIHHIDGDAENCIESNLQLLCPNCHSLTKNFRNNGGRISKRVNRLSPLAANRTGFVNRCESFVGSNPTSGSRNN